jgi:salicylate hydroxylase
VTSIIGAARSCQRWALFDRDPLPRWSDGRVTLLGDACHPMPPFLAQGAALAIEDAVVLARCLISQAEQPEAALLAYEEKRKVRAAKVLAAARSNMGVFHRSNIVTQLATYGPMRIADKLMPAFVRSRLDWIYAYDATRA